MTRILVSTSSVLSLLFLVLSNVSCILQSQKPSTTQHNNIVVIENTLKGEFEVVLKNQVSDLSMDIVLFFSSNIDINQYRNAKSISNPGGLEATRHEFFILVDNLYPIYLDNFLDRYELIVSSAQCLSKDHLYYPGCTLLRNARKYLTAAKKQPGLFRPEWPKWRPISVIPENWAEENVNWSNLNIKTDLIDAHMDYLYIKLIRGWYSEGFIESGDWYIQGACKGFISDGQPDNDNKKMELLPQIPTGILLAKNLVITSHNNKVWEWQSPRIIGWLNKPIPLSPQYPDPCMKECPYHNKVKQYCVE